MDKLRNGKAIIAIIIVLAMLGIVIGQFFAGDKKSGSIEQKRNTNPDNITFTKEGVAFILNTSGDTISRLDIEFADSDYKIQRGMMFRKQMDMNQGMLFLMPEEKIQSFWMKNCYLSLDMIFADSQGIIGSAQKYTEPYSMTSLPSEGPAKYVLEVNAGYWDKYELQPGYKLVFNRL